MGQGSGSMGKRGWLNIVGAVRVGVGVGERGGIGGSAPELRLIVDDTITEGTVLGNGDAAKGRQVVDGVETVEVQNGLNEDGGRVWGVHAADEIAHKKFHMSQSLSSGGKGGVVHCGSIRGVVLEGGGCRQGCRYRSGVAW